MLVKKWARTGLAVLLCTTGAWRAADAQTGVGAIGGIIADESGAILPGATVTLSSAEGTVNGNQSTVTDARGGYQFIRLVPGVYSVRAELQGFKTVQQTNLTVNADTTVRADIRLGVGTYEEVLTVTGGAPLLDTTTAARVTTVSREEFEALPNRTDIWSMARAVPGVVIGKLDTGGVSSFENSTVIVRGTSDQNKYMMDGMDISSVAAGSGIANLYLDPYLFEETNFQIGAGSAEHSVGGLITNMVTRTGTNQMHGGVKFNGTPPGLARSRNYSPALRAQLLSGVPARVLAANPDIEPNADVRKMSDAGAWLAGPVLRDKLWFSTAWHDQRLDQYRLGSYDPDGTPVLDDNVMWSIAGKLAWQMGRNAQLSYFGNLQNKVIGHRGGGTFADSKARNYNYKYPTVHQVKFTAPVGSRVAIEASYNRFLADDIFVPRPEVHLGDVATFDTTTQVANVALPTYSDNWMQRHQARGNVSLSTADHDLKAGFEFVNTGRKTRVWSLSGMRANFANGVPASVNTYVVPVSTSGQQFPTDEIDFLFGYREDIVAAYLQDRWRLSDKIVVNAGLRFEGSNSFMPPTCQPASLFTAGGPCYDRIDAPSFRTFTPRFSLIYDLAGDGRTALKFAANRYIYAVGIGVIERLNPISTPNDQRQWLPQSRCGTAGVLGCDLNGDLIPQINELGPAPGYVYTGVNARYENGFKQPVSDDFSVEIQHEFGRQIMFAANYGYRKSKNAIGSRNTALPPDAWLGPFPVTEITSGESVTVWNRPSAQSANLFYNSDDFSITFKGVDVSLSKRMGDRWSLSGGGSFGRIRAATRGGNRSDPNIVNSPYDRNGLSENDRPWSYRLSGVYEAPYQVMVSGSWLFQAGAPEVTTVLVTNQTIALSQGNQTILARPVGDRRYPNLAAVDLNLRRMFKAGRTTIAPRLELFNITNQATIATWVTQLGPSYQQPSVIQRGRLIKFEVEWQF